MNTTKTETPLTDGLLKEIAKELSNKYQGKPIDAWLPVMESKYVNFARSLETKLAEAEKAQLEAQCNLVLYMASRVEPTHWLKQDYLKLKQQNDQFTAQVAVMLEALNTALANLRNLMTFAHSQNFISPDGRIAIHKIQDVLESTPTSALNLLKEQDELRERVGRMEKVLTEISKTSMSEEGCYYTNKSNIILARKSLTTSPAETK